MTTQTTIGDLIHLFYEQYLDIYGDEDLASVAAAATINEILSEAAEVEQRLEPAEAA